MVTDELPAVQHFLTINTHGNRHRIEILPSRPAFHTQLRTSQKMTEKAYSNMLPLAAEPAASAQSDLSALRDLALSLRDAGQAEQALLLLKQLAVSHPGDVEILRQSARLLKEQGRVLECLHTLLCLKALNPATDFLIEEIRGAIDPTI